MAFDTSKLFQAYQSHETIKEYLDDLVQRFSTKIEIFSQAVSYEGREIRTVRICPDVKQPPRSPNKRWTILIDAGIHAREWITVSVALFIVHQLIEQDEISAKSFRRFEWIILPLLNPDGYQYSREHVRINQRLSHALRTFPHPNDVF